jgi:hypothetical protein
VGFAQASPTAVDEYRLMIHPIVVGGGKRLFRDGNPLNRLTLVDSKTSPTGVAILTYQPGRPIVDSGRLRPRTVSVGAKGAGPPPSSLPAIPGRPTAGGAARLMPYVCTSPVTK